MKGRAPSPRYHALIELMRASEALWNASRFFFARWDLSPSQFNVLNLLNDHPRGLTQIELSRQLIMHRSNVTGLIDRLESRGLAQRQDIAADRRAFNIVLTPAGKKLVRQIQPHYYRTAEKLWSGVPPTRVKQLIATLHGISQSAAELK
jgi:MarR family 2-MHQ and catechol resistance regulon transcriptional repressor